MTEPVITFVVVNYDTGAMVRRCVESFAGQSTPWRMVVVDNPTPAGHDPSLDGLPALAGTNGHVEIRRAPENQGYGRACNLGLSDVATPYVGVLNPDTALPPGALDRWMAAIAREMNHGLAAGRRPVGLLAPTLLNDNGTAQRSVYRFQNGLNYWAYHSLLAGLLKTLKKRPGSPPSAGQPAGAGGGFRPGAAVEIEWAMGAAYLLPADAWRAVAGFDPDYFLYAEDTDLCWRLRAAGYRVMHAPDVAIVHTQGEPSAARRGDSMIRLFAGLKLFTSKRLPPARRLGLRAAVLLDMLIRFALFAPLVLVRPGDTLTRSRLRGALTVLGMYLRS